MPATQGSIIADPLDSRSYENRLLGGISNYSGGFTGDTPGGSFVSPTFGNFLNFGGRTDYRGAGQYAGVNDPYFHTLGEITGQPWNPQDSLRMGAANHSTRSGEFAPTAEGKTHGEGTYAPAFGEPSQFSPSIELLTDPGFMTWAEGTGDKPLTNAIAALQAGFAPIAEQFSAYQSSLPEEGGVSNFIPGMLGRGTTAGGTVRSNLQGLDPLVDEVSRRFAKWKEKNPNYSSPSTTGQSGTSLLESGQSGPSQSGPSQSGPSLIGPGAPDSGAEPTAPDPEAGPLEATTELLEVDAPKLAETDPLGAQMLVRELESAQKAFTGSAASRKQYVKELRAIRKKYGDLADARHAEYGTLADETLRRGMQIAQSQGRDYQSDLIRQQFAEQLGAHRARMQQSGMSKLTGRSGEKAITRDSLRSLLEAQSKRVDRKTAAQERANANYLQALLRQTQSGDRLRETQIGIDQALALLPRENILSGPQMQKETQRLIPLLSPPTV